MRTKFHKNSNRCRTVLKTTNVGELLQAALQRQRCRLTLETVYNYDQIVHFLQELDSNWNVYVHPVLGETALSAAWPKKEDAKETLDWLTSNGCRNAQDVLDGACVPLARLCGVQACQLLLEGKQPAVVATEVHSSCLQRLRGLSPDDAAELVFTELKQRKWKVSRLQAPSLSQYPSWLQAPQVGKIISAYA